MKTKRIFLSLIPVVCLAIALVPKVSFAATEGNDCAGGSDCTHEAAVGSTHYDTLNDAISAAGGETIQLLRSITVSEPVIITSDTVIDGASDSGVFQITPSSDSSSHGNTRQGLFHLNSETDTPVTLTLKNIELINKNANGKWSDACGISVRASNQTVNLEHVTVDTSHYCVFVGVPGAEEEDINDVTVNINQSKLTGYAAVYYRTNSTTNMIMRPVLNVTDSELTGRGCSGSGNGFSTIVYNGTRDARASIIGCTLSNSFDSTNADANEGIIQFNCFGAYEKGAEITISHSTIKTRSTTAAPNVIKYTAGENLNVGNKVIIDDLTIMVDENENDLIRVMRNENELVATEKKLDDILSLMMDCYGDKPGGSTSQNPVPLLMGGDTVLVPIDTVLSSDATIPENVTVLVSKGAKLTIQNGVKLSGAAGAKLIVQGTVEGIDGITDSGSYTWEDNSWIVSDVGVTLNRDTLTLQKEGTAQLIATVQTENAENKDVIWTSSNEKVATVDANGKVTALSCGTAVITATLEGTAFTDSCSVKVDHILTKTGEKPATCTEDGYTGDKVCRVCGEVIEKGTVIKKSAHNYKDGKCTVCGAADPKYKPGSTTIPQTGDTSNMTLWIALMLAAGAVLTGIYVYNRKRNKSNK